MPNGPDVHKRDSRGTFLAHFLVWPQQIPFEPVQTRKAPSDPALRGTREVIMPTSSKSSVLDCRRPGNTHIRTFKAPSHTQMPNEIFDELMHDLSGAEFKVVFYRTTNVRFSRHRGLNQPEADLPENFNPQRRRLDHGTGVGAIHRCDRY